LIATYTSNGRVAETSDVSEKTNLLAQSTKFTIRDNSQHEGKVYILPNGNADVSYYELPPTPPVSLFDVRFNNNRFVDNSNSTVLSMQGIEYPVSIGIDYADANYTFYDAVSNVKLGQVSKGTNGTIEIKSTKANQIKVLRNDNGTEFSFVNYPNPVLTASTIEYSIPENENVLIQLYDVIGHPVSTLVNEFKNAGDYTVTLNAENLTSGRYICKLTAGSNTSVINLSIVK
jgi:hypothetical protein